MFFRLLIFCGITLMLSTSLWSQEKVELYHINGELHRTGQLVDGLHDGRWQEYNSSGGLVKETNYSNGRIQTEIWYESGRRKERSIEYLDDGRKIYRQFTKAGMLRAMSDINPNLLSDSAAIADMDTGFFVNLMSDQGQFRGNSYHHPHGTLSAFPIHEFHSRARLKSVRCGTNYISWHRYSGPHKAEGYFEQSGEFELLEWPERGFPDDPYTRSFDKTKLESKLKSFFINGLPYNNWLNYYPNGQLWYSINYTDGIPSGPYQAWYHTGQQMVKARFLQGQLDGECVEWHPHGQEKYKGEYSKGKRIGTWTYWTAEGQISEQLEFDDNGYLTHEETFFPNGQIKGRRNHCLDGGCDGASIWEESGDLSIRILYGAKELYKEGKLLGIMSPWRPDIFFDHNGEPMIINGLSSGTGMKLHLNSDGGMSSAIYLISEKDSIVFDFESDPPVLQEYVSEGIDTKVFHQALRASKKKGFKMEGSPSNGKMTLYYPGGTKWYEGSFSNGLPDGEHRWYTIDGSLKGEVRYADNVPEGTLSLFREDGQPVERSEYKAGRLNGVRELFHPNGGVRQRAHYSQGKLHGTLEEWALLGRPEVKMEYASGQAHGRQTIFDYEGKDIGFYTYVNGIKSGAARVKEDKGDYVNGLRHGLWQLYENGEAVSVRYQMGRELKESDVEQCILNVADPLISELTETAALYESVPLSKALNWTSDKLQFDEDEYLSILMPDKSQSDSIQEIIIANDFTFQSLNLPGFNFDLSPTRVLGEYVKVPYEVQKTNYFMRDFSRFEEGFDGTVADYFHLGLDHYRMDEISTMDMMRDYLIESLGINRDSSYLTICRALVEQQIIDSIQETEDYSALSTRLMGRSEDFRNTMLEIGFGKSAETMPNSESTASLDQFFAPISGPDFKQDMDLRIGQFTADLKPTSFAMHMPDYMLSSPNKTDEKGARLLMKVNRIRFNTDNGLSIISASDFCFAEGRVGGSAISMDFDNPQIVMRPRKLRQLIPNTQDYYFYAENLGLEFKGVFAAEAWGMFHCENGEEIFVEYANIGICDKYLAGRFTINMPDEHRHEVFKAIEEAFTYHEIISEYGTVLEIYFMRLKPKNP